MKLVTQRGVSAPQAAKDLDVHENVLRKWVRELREAPQEAFPVRGKQKVQDAEIARLRKEVAELKMERDILKKAAAYFVVHEIFIFKPKPICFDQV